MSDQTIKLSDINADFNDSTEPQDERLTHMLKLAYQHNIFCRVAVVPMANIEPFSDFQPKISEDYAKYFEDQYKAGKPPTLLVYMGDKGKFVMSDDYNAYHMYKRLNIAEAVCELLDAETVPEGVIDASDVYYMDIPSAVQIN